MPHIPSSDCLAPLTRAQMLLGLSQGELAERLGTSRRSVTRWHAGESLPGTEQLAELARLVHRHDASTAARLAEEAGTTLVALGLKSEAPPPAAPESPPSAPLREPPPRAFPPTRLMVESIVCAASETMQVLPAEVRAVLQAAFSRARGLGLTVEEVDDALSPPPESPTTPAAPVETATPRARGRAAGR
jgi:transcriptional regulator with XRE-family HTH domain